MAAALWYMLALLDRTHGSNQSSVFGRARTNAAWEWLRSPSIALIQSICSDNTENLRHKTRRILSAGKQYISVTVDFTRYVHHSKNGSEGRPDCLVRQELPRADTATEPKCDGHGVVNGGIEHGRAMRGGHEKAVGVEVFGFRIDSRIV